MRERPLSVTVIGWIFIAVGAIALVVGWVPLAQRLTEFKEHPFENAPVFLARVLAVLCGVFMLCGFNWARWLLVVWIGYHVVIGLLHSPGSGLVHGLLFAVVVYFLFRPRASAYFRDSKAEPPEIQKTDDTPVV